MNHYVLTRAVYDPELWTEEANLRRLELMRHVTARSLMGNARDGAPFDWVVQVHPADPFRAHRRRIVEQVGGWVVDFPNLPATAEMEALARGRRGGDREVLAVQAYRAWQSALPPGLKLTTRIDDDDAFAYGALAKIQAVAWPLTKPTAIVQPVGIRILGGRYDVVRHASNAWQSLVSETATVYDHPHRRVAREYPVKLAGQQLSWLWVRHRDTLSGQFAAATPLTPDVMDLFPVDWSVLPPPARTKGKRGAVRFR